MKYSTYIAAAERLSILGQKKKASSLVEHAVKQERRKIDELNFNILVGEVRRFDGAKFHSVQVLREREANTLMCIFHSDVNTHRICANLKSNGDVVWSDGNLFSDRQSVRSYEKLLCCLSSYHPDIKKLLSEIEVHKDSIRVLGRTFYI